MATIEGIRQLKKEGKNREIIAAVESENIQPSKPRKKEDDEKLLEKAWAHHQLGEYDRSIPIMYDLAEYYSSSSEIGESALRGCAHGLLQRDGNIDAADAIMLRIPPGLNRDNVRMNMMIMAARKSVQISAAHVIAAIMNALEIVPYTTINGHIINNGTLALYEAREQDDVKSYLPILPGLMFAAINIYGTTGTAKNHIAGAIFRASQICETAGWRKFARIEAETSQNRKNYPRRYNFSFLFNVWL